MKRAELITLIQDGRLDSILDQLADAVYKRKRALSDRLAVQNLENLKPGIRVRITGNIKPKYLLGEEGEVLSRREAGGILKAGFLPVKLDRGPIRRYGGVVNVPAACLEEIS